MNKQIIKKILMSFENKNLRTAIVGFGKLDFCIYPNLVQIQK